MIAGANAFCRGAARWCAREPLRGEVRRAYLAPYARWRDRKAVLRFVQDIPITPDDPGFAQLKAVEASFTAFRNIPALLAWGLRDFVFNEAFLERWHALLPQAEVHRFDGGGHYLLEDHAHEVLGHVSRFLERTVSIPPSRPGLAEP